VTTRVEESVLLNGGEPHGYCVLPGRGGGVGSGALAGAACPPRAFDVGLGGGLTNGTCAQMGAPLSWGGGGGMTFGAFGFALLTSFVASSEEGWTTVVYSLWATWGWRWLVCVAFSALVIAEDVGVTLSDALISHAYYTAADADRVRADTEAAPAVVKTRLRQEAEAHAEMWGTGARALAPGGGAVGLGARLRAASAAAWAAAGRTYDAVVPTVPPDVRFTAQAIVANPNFDYFFLAVVIANVVAMAAQYRGAPPSLLHATDVCNAVFVFLFVGELVVRVVAAGVAPFFRDAANVFDALVVGVSLADTLLGLLNVSAIGASLSALRALRLFRALRMLKIARSWKNLAKLLKVMRSALLPITQIFIILSLVILVFAVIGMQLFGGTYAAALAEGRITAYPRGHFDDMFQAVVTVFTCVEGENWFVPLYEHAAVAGTGTAAAFFVALRLLGGLLFGLVLGVFMRSFDEADEAEERASLASQLVAARRVSSWMPTRGDAASMGTALHLSGATDAPEKIVFTLAPRGSEPPTCLADTGAVHAFLDGRSITLVVTVTAYGAVVTGRDLSSAAPGGAPPPMLSAWQLANESDAFDPSSLDRIAERLRAERAQYSARHAACGFLPPHSAVRRAAARVAANPAFDAVSLVITAWACVNLALEEPWLGGPACREAAVRCAAMYYYLDASDAALTLWFLLEVVIKCVAQGVYGPRTAFLQSKWNMLDVVILITSVVSLCAPPAAYNTNIVLTMRALRVFRAARLLKRVPTLLVIAETVFSVGAMAPNAVAVVLIFLLIFAVVGQQLFSGGLNACNDPSASSAAACVGNWTLTGSACALLPTEAAEAACRAWDGVAPALPAAVAAAAAAAAANANAVNATLLQPPFTFPRLWEPLQPNWDNLGSALLQMFLLLDGENWPSFMYATVDGAEDEVSGLSRNANPSYAVFFLMSVLLLESVVLDVFTGVVRSTFVFITTAAGGKRHLTRGQLRLLENASRVLEVKPVWTPPEPQPHELPLLRWLYVGAHAPAFGAATRALHVATLGALVVRAAAPPPGLDATLLGLALAALAETLVKVAAWGPSHSIASGVGAFDATCSVAAVVSGVASLGVGAPGGGAAGVAMRVALSARCLLIVVDVERSGRLLEPLEPLLRALRRVAPQILQVLAFKTVLIFCYAVVGMAAFGSVRHGVAPDPTTGLALGGSTGNLNGVANFETFPVAFFTLFRGQTGENWNQLMFDLGVAPPYCTRDAGDARGTRDGCGSFSGAVLFWVSFKVLCTFVVDAVLGATVLKALWDEVPPSKDDFVPWDDPRGRRLFVFTHAHGNAFRDAWALTVDPHGAGLRASRHQLASLMLLLPPPMGLRGALADPAAAHAAAESAVAAMPLLADDALRTVVVERGGGASRAGIPFHLALHALVLYASKGFEADLAGAVRGAAPEFDMAQDAARKAAAQVR